MKNEATQLSNLSSIYTIEGMTCQSCVKTITEKVLKIPGVSEVQVSLTEKSVKILSQTAVGLDLVKNALIESPKYTVSEFKIKSKTDTKSTATVQTAEKKDSLLKTYKPLITVFAFVLFISLAHQLSLGHFNSALFMNHLMAGFFIGLSFFKFLDLKAFAESFSSYDPIAQRWLNYGYYYAFIELILGLLFISGKFLVLANVTTIFILTFTTYGVYKRLQSKSKFQCACLGTTFNLPLSNVTIAENVVMILMAATSLLAVG